MSGVKDWMFKARGRGDGPFGGPGPSQAGGGGSGGGGGGGGGNGRSCAGDGDCGPNSVCRNGRCRSAGPDGNPETGVDGSAATYQGMQNDMLELVKGLATTGDLSNDGVMGDFLTNRVAPALQRQYDAWRMANPKVKKNGMLDWMETQQPFGEGGPDWLTAPADEQAKKKKKQQQNKNGQLDPGTSPQQLADWLYRDGIGNYIDLTGFGQGSTRWSGF